MTWLHLLLAAGSVIRSKVKDAYSRIRDVNVSTPSSAGSGGMVASQIPTWNRCLNFATGVFIKRT